MSKIIKLISENVKKLHAVEITPDGNVIVIGGKNGAGKSSVLDSIQYALGGDPSDRMPVRRGEDKAKIVLDLGEIVVRRTFTAAGGTSLVVTNSDGVKQSTPQAILDKLVGKLTFDPLAFSRERPKQQAEILRALIGLDFAHQDSEREKLFTDRTEVNRDAKALEARMASAPIHAGVPDKEESTADILAEQQKAAEQNQANDAVRRAARDEQDNAKRLETDTGVQRQALENTKAEIKQLTELLEKQTAELEKRRQGLQIAQNRAAESVTKAAALKDIDLSPFQARAQKVEETNRKVRESKQRAELVTQFKAKTSQAEKLTDKLTALDSAKRKATTEAKYPVDGLMFDTAGGVTLNGIPFEQCSAAEQLKVSIAVGLALNPKLRILLIRDGSLLDDDSMKVVLDMATAADAQVWLERVGTDAQTSVVIEDGSVLQPELAV